MKSELVSIIIVKEINDQKGELKRILSKHKVREPEEIESWIGIDAKTVKSFSENDRDEDRS